MFECMYHREDQLDAEYGETTLEDKLDILENFVRVTPMPIKSGEMVFLCNCSEAYKSYACVHSGVLSTHTSFIENSTEAGNLLRRGVVHALE